MELIEPNLPPEPVLPPAFDQYGQRMKVCRTCQKNLALFRYTKTPRMKDGHLKDCKSCMAAKLKARKAEGKGMAFPERKKRARVQNLKYEDQPEAVKKIVCALAANPKMTRAELAKAVGLSIVTVDTYLYSNDFLAAVRVVGAQSITNMIPQAINTLGKALESTSEEVKFKAATKILENERVLGPNRLEIDVNDLSKKPFEELEKMYEQMPTVPRPVLDVQEIIS